MMSRFVNLCFFKPNIDFAILVGSPSCIADVMVQNFTQIDEIINTDKFRGVHVTSELESLNALRSYVTSFCRHFHTAQITVDKQVY